MIAALLNIQAAKSCLQVLYLSSNLGGAVPGAPGYAMNAEICSHKHTISKTVAQAIRPWSVLELWKCADTYKQLRQMLVEQDLKLLVGPWVAETC